MTKSPNDYERRLGMLLLARRFSDFAPGQERLRELAEAEKDETVRAEARELLKDRPVR